MFRNLYTRRKAARLEAEARARGEDVDYLTTEAPEAFRAQLILALMDTGGREIFHAATGSSRGPEARSISPGAGRTRRTTSSC